MTVRIGANPIGWSNDDLPSIGGSTPLETCLSEAREAGIEGMELGNKFPREAEALKAALAPFGLACVGGWHSIELLNRSAAEEFELAKPHRDLLKAMGTDVFIVAETSNCIHGRRDVPLSRRPHLAEGDWAGYGARMTELAELLAAEGLKLCYHHHMGTIVESEADIHRFMDHTRPPVHLLLDTGHATWGGSDPASLAQRYRDRISHVHVKDVRKAVMEQARREDWSFLDAILGQGQDLGVYTVPGDGMVDYPAVFRALPGYSGWVVIEAEQDPEKANPLRYAKLGVANLKRYLADAGFGKRHGPVALLLHPHAPGPDGRVHHVTPESAGWTYVGFDVFDLADGGRVDEQAGDRETCIVMISGRARVRVGDREFGTIGERGSVFEGLPWSVYGPAGSSYRIEADGPCEVAVCTAPGTGTKPARLIAPADVKEETRGTGSNVRHVRNILADFDDRAESLLVVEVITPAGNWSSYPPHKHDQDNFPAETLLEETYYHRFSPPQGYGMQRVYTDDRSLDEALAFGDRDVVLVPRGYHPVGAAHGYDLYYLNVMAGPRRAWRFHNDPAHEWLIKA